MSPINGTIPGVTDGEEAGVAPGGSVVGVGNAVGEGGVEADGGVDVVGPGLINPEGVGVGVCGMEPLVPPVGVGVAVGVGVPP